MTTQLFSRVCHQTFFTLTFLTLPLTSLFTRVAEAATFAQSISDWYTPQGYPGESAAVTMGYRDRSDGARDGRTFYLYGYSFPLDPTKTVSGITLPNDPNVEVLGIAMVL